MRLDQAIAARFPHISRRKARELIAAGRVLVNQRAVRIASREVADDAQIAVAAEGVPHPKLLAITDDWLAVDKEAGLPTQPTRDRVELSLEEILRLEYRQIYLVHRLDTPVSGVVLFARTRAAAATFSELFATGAMRKIYLARVDRAIDAIIDTPIDGKEALTIVRPLRDALVEIEIKTGRTHQIRRHLASIGHPVLGDARYGGAPAERLMLHAWKLEHPSVGILEAPPPIHFAPDG
jgi:tRNA pseudouridine32 synthase/23S rRNA pseudouridine746 synthase